MILSFSLRMDSVSNENTKPKTVEFSFEQSNSETEPPKPPRLFSVRSDVPDRSLIPNRAREIPNLAPNESNRVRLPEEHPRPRKIGFLFALLVLILLASSFASDIASTKFISDLVVVDSFKEKKNQVDTRHPLTSSASCSLDNETKIITVLCHKGSRQYSIRDLNLFTCRYEF